MGKKMDNEMETSDPFSRDSRDVGGPGLFHENGTLHGKATWELG